MRQVQTVSAASDEYGDVGRIVELAVSWGGGGTNAGTNTEGGLGSWGNSPCDPSAELVPGNDAVDSESETPSIFKSAFSWLGMEIDETESWSENESVESRLILGCTTETMMTPALLFSGGKDELLKTHERNIHNQRVEPLTLA